MLPGSSSFIFLLLYFNQIALTTFFSLLCKSVELIFFFCWFIVSSFLELRELTRPRQQQQETGGCTSQTINQSGRREEGAGIIKSKMIPPHRSGGVVRIVKVSLMFDSAECSEAALSHSQTLGSVCVLVVGWWGG